MAWGRLVSTLALWGQKQPSQVSRQSGMALEHFPRPRFQGSLAHARPGRDPVNSIFADYCMQCSVRFLEFSELSIQTPLEVKAA